MRPGRERLSRAFTAEEIKKDREKGEDMKETYDIGREGQKGNPQSWPDKLDKDGVLFRETMQDFFLRCKQLHVVLMRGIAAGLGLDVGFFDGMVDQGDNNLRLLHYPSVGREAFHGGRLRAGAHSDYGSVTFLFQDQRGGLQVEKRDGSGEWIDAEPREGTIVINAGDSKFLFLLDCLPPIGYPICQVPRLLRQSHTRQIRVVYLYPKHFDVFGQGSAADKDPHSVSTLVQRPYPLNQASSHRTSDPTAHLIIRPRKTPVSLLGSILLPTKSRSLDRCFAGYVGARGWRKGVCRH